MSISQCTPHTRRKVPASERTTDISESETDVCRQQQQQQQQRQNACQSNGKLALASLRLIYAATPATENVPT